jgi:hypothetical protein
LATPNYGYEKRQRELAKKQKKEEKLRAKAQRKPDDSPGEQADEGHAAEPGNPEQPSGADA